MALYLPQPSNDVEQFAFTVIRDLERYYSLAPTAPVGPWLAALVGAMAAGRVSRVHGMCAARWILRQAPFLGKDLQWSILSIVSCYDAAALNPRTIAQMGNMQAAIAAMYRAWATPTGLTPPQFKLLSAELVRYMMTEGDPALRLAVTEIQVFRRCYARLRLQLFGA